MNKIAIPKRFRQEIELHLIRNLDQNAAIGTPLILAVHGSSGAGKSFQIETVLNELGVEIEIINSSSLESERANEPAKMIRNVYSKLAKKIEDEGSMHAIMIDDIDTALGNLDELVQTTINRQTVIGELMHLCDQSSSFLTRVPIFVTANDLSKIYGPMRRPGRMRSFYWQPTIVELSDSLKNILPNLLDSQISELVSDYKNYPIAFFVDAINRARENYYIDKITQYGCIETLRMAFLGYLNPEQNISYIQLISTCKIVFEEIKGQKDYSK